MSNSKPSSKGSKSKTFQSAGAEILSEGSFFSIGQLIQGLFQYRFSLQIVSIVVVSLYLLICLIAVLKSPPLKIASAPFHLNFKGAEDGLYPNGLTFSSEEVISDLILSEVYNKNVLEEFGLSLDGFLSTVFVVKNNPQLALLDSEFQRSLRTLRLNAVEQQQLKELYFSKREQLKSASFSLSLSLPLGLTSLPDKLVEKILMDILNVWANFADQQKRVMQYTEGLDADNFIPKELLVSVEDIIQADILRSKLLRVLKTVELISKIPGSQLVRVGKEQVSLAELQEGLNDLLTIKVEPLLYWLPQGNTVTDLTMVKAYISARLQNVIRKRKNLSQNKAVVLDSIQRYAREISQTGVLSENIIDKGTSEGSTGVLMPQIGVSFLDRILAMSKSHEKDSFFKNLIEQYMNLGMEHSLLTSSLSHYAEMGKMIKGLVKRKMSREGKEYSGKVISSVFKEIRAILNNLKLLEETLSKANLNPRVELYTLSGPIRISTIRSISYSYLAMIGLVVLFATFVLTSVGCFLHSVLSQTR